jgi:ParB family transcriptional regulator, chromosome partitioning protein
VIEKVLTSKIIPNPWNPRQSYDSDSIGELALAMDSQGVFAGALRGRRVNGNVELCFGHRRLRAMKKNGAHHVEVDIVELSDEEMQVQAVIENMQRAELTEIEKADAVAKLCQTRSQAAVAKLLGFTRHHIGQLCSVSQLPAPLRTAVAEKKLAAESATIAHRIGGTEFAEVVAGNHINREGMRKIAAEIGRVKNPEVREQVKASAAKGHIKSVKDVQDKAKKYSTPKEEERIPNVGEILILARVNQLDVLIEMLEGLAPFGWQTRQSASWKDFHKSFQVAAKLIEKIESAERPKEK